MIGTSFSSVHAENGSSPRITWNARTRLLGSIIVRINESLRMLKRILPSEHTKVTKNRRLPIRVGRAIRGHFTLLCHQTLSVRRVSNRASNA